MLLHAFLSKYGPRTTLGFAKCVLLWHKGGSISFNSHKQKCWLCAAGAKLYSPVQYSIKDSFIGSWKSKIMNIHIQLQISI